MMTFGEPEIAQVVECAWNALLGWDLALAGGAHPEGCLTASVGISGAWTGEVMLRCDQALGRAVAACLFGVAEEEADREMVQDALGEMANIVAGNLKPLFGGKCRLGLPTLADSAARAPGGRTLFRVPFSSRGLGFVVEVSEAAPVAV